MAVSQIARALRPAVFFDKDGTLVDDVPFNVDPARIRLAPGAHEAIAALAQAGFALFVISNQGGVARGHFAESALATVHTRLRELVHAAGGRLAGFYYCPHDPAGHVETYARVCDCRKPRPGLILQAAQAHGIDLASSWFVGDILHDIEAGNRAGCRTVLIDNGNETEWVRTPLRTPDASVGDLAAAAAHILRGAPTAVWRRGFA